MSTLAELIVRLLEHTPGLTDREITDQLRGHSAAQQPINQKCHALQEKGIILRQRRHDGMIGNFLAAISCNNITPQKDRSEYKTDNTLLSEDEVKQFLETWLISEGWQVQIAWGHSPGVDIEASKGTKHWLIEVKGSGSLNAMRVNYFLSVIGELLQRMNNQDYLYSIAFPDIQQFRNLWGRFPPLAKSRTQISALFVSKEGKVVHL